MLQELQGELTEQVKGGLIKAQDVCDIVAGKQFQALFTCLGI